ncbi:MAG: Rieske (2Fe-2S) protein [Bryobacteraceae bacterium]
MAFVKLAALKDVLEGSAVHIPVGEGAVAICNVGGSLHAMDGICPHSWGPLGHGALHGTTLVCPFHSWGFDCTTGQSDVDHHLKLATYPVRVEGDDILVDVP